MKRATVGVVAALVLATGNLAGGLVPAEAASGQGGSTAEPQGLSIMICRWMPWMC